jgi:hypothetical protein
LQIVQLFFNSGLIFAIHVGPRKVVDHEVLRSGSTYFSRSVDGGLTAVIRLGAGPVLSRTASTERRKYLIA